MEFKYYRCVSFKINFGEHQPIASLNQTSNSG